jgi:hypothetical protein
MEMMLFLALFGGGLLVALVIMVMLQRAWGDFPGSGSQLPPAQMPIPGQSIEPEPDIDDDAELFDQEHIPTSGLVAVENVFVRRALEQVLSRPGTPVQQHFVRQDQTIYLNLDSIGDPQRRAQAGRAIMLANQGNITSWGDLARLLQTISDRR